MEDYTYRKVNDWIGEAENILVAVHKKPDGDALGSSSALIRWMRGNGKRVTPFCLDLPPQQFHFIDNMDLYTNDPEVFEDNSIDLVVVLDSGDLHHAGIAELVENIPSTTRIINIDHHATNMYFGHLNLVDDQASSTAEIIYRFMIENSIDIEPETATSLVMGIITDTGAFSNPATNFKSIDAASELITLGARTQDVINHLFRNKSMSALRLWGVAMERLREHPDLNITCSCLTHEDMQKTNATSEDVEGIINFLNMYLNVDVVLLLRETGDGMIKGSLRSINRDVSKIASIFGGGGHKKAAGFSIPGSLQLDGEVWKIV